ncbi:hypothetical protein HK100_008184 [Physocladia obscura]|uniref:Uncharacterized protein n=1 Tax=Physocladia obscura TaxID=109957 RepID=A0AAD5XIG8_9FUNG|nr:hypothetical protein HK100_008184 [Physocladia obscura]
MSFHLQFRRVKKIKEYRSLYFDPSAIPDQTATICHICAILDVICQICRFQKYAPQNFEKLIKSPVRLALQLQIAGLKQQTPHGLIISHCNSNCMLQFIRAFEKGPIQIIDVFVASLYYNAAICLLNRPTVYTTAFLRLDSLLLTPDTILTILTSLQESVSAAKLIANMNAYILRLGGIAGIGGNGWNDGNIFFSGGGGGIGIGAAEFRDKLWTPNSFAAFALFEAAIVLWFVTCRTRAFWWSTSRRHYYNVATAVAVVTSSSTSSTTAAATAVNAGVDGSPSSVFSDWQQSLSTISLDANTSNMNASSFNHDSESIDIFRMTREEVTENLNNVRDILKTLHEIDFAMQGPGTSGFSTMVKPLVACVAEMVLEMEQFVESLDCDEGVDEGADEEMGNDDDRDDDDDDGGGGLGGGKFVIGDDVIEFFDATRPPRPFFVEPWVFLG